MTGAINTHAIERARERYGLTLDRWDLLAIASIIRAGKTVLTRRQRDGREVHALEYRGVAVVALYDLRDRCVTTFLPMREVISSRAARRGRKTAKRHEAGAA
jgi:hypothetical protein